mgnify:CR=1 FL=1
MNTANVTNAIRALTAAADQLEKAIAAFDAEGEKIRAAAEAAAQKYMDDVARKKSAVADQIQALDKKAAVLIQQKQAITKDLAQRACESGQDGIEAAQKQLTSIVAENATIDEMKAALKAGKIPGDPSLYADAEEAQKALDTVNAMRGEVYAKMYPVLKGIISQLEAAQRHANDYANNQGGMKLANRTLYRVREHHSAPDYPADPASRPEPAQARNL